MSTKFFTADADRFAKAFALAGAIRTEADGFQWIDESRVSAQMLSAYRLHCQYGFANGLMA